MAYNLILTSTTRPLRLRYDATHYADFAVSAAGALTITPMSGQDLILFASVVKVVDSVRYSAAADSYVDFSSGGASGNLIFRDGSGFAERMRIAGSKVLINDTSNAGMTIGLSINQGASDDEIISLKSSDVAHGMTGVTETNTYASCSKASATAGGLLLAGLSEATQAIVLRALATTEETGARSTASRGAIFFDGYKKSGTSAGALAADANILAVGTNGVTRFVLDSDGDSHQDVGTAWTNFDTHDDIALLNLMSAHVTREDDPLRQTFVGWLEQGRDELERIRLVKFNDDGHHFVNMSRLQMLTVGAVRQLADRLASVEQKLLAA